MRIFAISEGAVTHDVTDVSHCLSSESRLLKASPTCASVYVDGSEKRGSARVAVHIQYNSMNTEITFCIWYPRLPLTVSVDDQILNSIDKWITNVLINTKMKRYLNKFNISQRRNRQRRRSDLYSCKHRFQQTQVCIL